LVKHLGGCFKTKRARASSAAERPDAFDSFYIGEQSGLYGRSLSSGVMTSEKLCEQVLRIIISGNHSFCLAENTALVALLRHAYPDIKQPNRRSVATKLKEHAIQAKDHLKAELQKVDSKISLALDAWSTRSGPQSFLGTYVPSPTPFWQHGNCQIGTSQSST